MDIKKEFGKNLRELRLRRNTTQEKMAEIIDIQPENYSRIENGLSFPKPENIVKISQALDVEIAELFQFSNINNYEQVLEKIISKLKNDEQTTVMTYKYLKSMGKI